ncbi:MAG: LTA synthase family protein [Paludibacteraceae bacterium]|nr:LTA synthase family protein [Paludibacteraceae bacterium]
MRHYLRYIGRILLNILLIYLTYFVARLAYLLENWSYFLPGLQQGNIWRMFIGSVYLDTPAICYTNALWLLLILLPLHYKDNWYTADGSTTKTINTYQKVCKWLFVVVNSLTFIIQLCDAVYFKFTLRRTTITVFNEFSSEGNILQIFATEFISHWYFMLLGVAVIALMWYGYSEPVKKTTGLILPTPSRLFVRYYLPQTLTLLVFAYFTVVGMRGGFTRDIRPINVNRAGQFIIRPTDVALILNTPFTMLKSIGHTVYTQPHYFNSPEEAQAVFNPIQRRPIIVTHPRLPEDDILDLPVKRKNIVFIIIESFGREYIGTFSRPVLGDDYEGYTPFTDSLAEHSLTFRHSFCNGRKSIDAMPAILSSLPMFIEPYVLTPQATNHIRGIAGYLGEMGYYSAFFHGAWAGSMGFQAFARSTEWQDYFSQEDYEADVRFDGHDDYDGWWAIFDEPFMQFFANKMTEFREPFVTGLFTATSHHPFRVPEQYADSFAEGTLPIHKTIRYVDHALRKFFQTARQQPWYDNTVFIITSDHTNMSDHDEYKSDIGGFCSPIIIYDPSGDIAPRRSNAIAQHIDMMPTMLNLVGYDKPYLTFGCDLLNTPDEDTYAVCYLNGTYQYVKHGIVLQFDAEKTTAAYRLNDYCMRSNILNGSIEPQLKDTLQEMETELKAIIEQYMYRMINNKLTP